MLSARAARASSDGIPCTSESSLVDKWGVAVVVVVLRGCAKAVGLGSDAGAMRRSTARDVVHHLAHLQLAGC